MSLRAKVVAVMAFPVAVLIASASVGYVAQRRSDSLLAASQHTAEVQHLVDAVLGDLVDAETGTRGYLLTGDWAFLAPFTSGSAAEQTDMAALTKLTSDDPAQAPRIARLRMLITDRLTTLVQSQRYAPVTDSTDRTALIGLMSEGRSTMDTIRSVLADLGRQESAILHQRQLSLEGAQHTLFLIVVFGAPGAALLALAVVFLFAQRVVTRISRIEQNARRLESGEPMVQESDSRDEIGDLGRVLVETGARLASLQQELRHLATVDELTGLANRRGFLAVAEHELRLASRLHENLAVMFIDLDDLKIVNDTLGHGVGDAMLKETAELLVATFRTSDLAARVGGDEFCVLLTTEEDPGARIALNRLREVAARMNLLPDRDYDLTFSAGIAEFDPDNPAGIIALMATADSRMYEEKRAKHPERASAPVGP